MTGRPPKAAATTQAGSRSRAYALGRKAAAEGRARTSNPFRAWLTPKAIELALQWDAGFAGAGFDTDGAA